MTLMCLSAHSMSASQLTLDGKRRYKFSWVTSIMLSYVISPAKIHFFFEMCKKNRFLGRFFVWRIGNYFRNEVNLFRNEVNFFRRQYSNTSYHWRSCLPCTALPFSHTAAWPQGSRHSMYCAQSSKWGLFGRNTRSAFRRTPSRWNKARYKRREENGNLNKSTFLSFGVLWSFLGSSLVSPWSLARHRSIRYKGVES